MIPVFNFHEGYLSVNYSDNYFRLSQRHPEVPRLSPKHYEVSHRCSLKIRRGVRPASNYACAAIRSPGPRLPVASSALRGDRRTDPARALSGDGPFQQPRAVP
mmetsp:Transcript_22135/g.52936  ORF Transcript_22135/g.52936 Transcript_22135/m.52936 type:complete len:103 (+) Transcript_22135:352-660(+)